jgi:hypothetical protein
MPNFLTLRWRKKKHKKAGSSFFFAPPTQNEEQKSDSWRRLQTKLKGPWQRQRLASAHRNRNGAEKGPGNRRKLDPGIDSGFVKFFLSRDGAVNWNTRSPYCKMADSCTGWEEREGEGGRGRLLSDRMRFVRMPRKRCCNTAE